MKDKEKQQLVQKYITNEISDDEAKILESELVASEEFRYEFLNYLNIDFVMSRNTFEDKDDAYIDGLVKGPGQLEQNKTKFSLSPVLLSVAALFILCFVIGWLTMADIKKSGVEVEVVKVEGVVSGDWQQGDKKIVDSLKLVRGYVQLILPSKVVLDVYAPSEINFIDSMKVKVLAGKVVADVGEHGKGFIIDTPQTRIVDLGTSFGVDVRDFESTDVVVFEGAVQVFKDHQQNKPDSTLIEGEAVRVDNKHNLSRIPNIVTGLQNRTWSTSVNPSDECVIATVSDNLRSPETKIFYEIIPGGFKEGVQAYVGPKHKWKGRTATGIPSYLLGADLVRTFMSDHRKQDLRIKVKFSKPAVLYVLFECRPQQELWRKSGKVEEVPEWLEKTFHKTGDAVGLDDAGQLKPGEKMNDFPGQGNLVTFDIWELKVSAPGEVLLGPPTGSDGWINWMYGFVAVPLKKESHEK